MNKYKVGDRVTINILKNSHRYDYPFSYNPSMLSLSGKQATIIQIHVGWMDHNDTLRKFYNGDQNVYILDIDTRWWWSSSMFLPKPPENFINLNVYVL